MHLADALPDSSGPHNLPASRHGIGFGKAIDDGPLFHPRERGDANMLMAIIGHLAILVAM